MPKIRFFTPNFDFSARGTFCGMALNKIFVCQLRKTQISCHTDLYKSSLLLSIQTITHLLILIKWLAASSRIYNTYLGTCVNNVRKVCFKVVNTNRCAPNLQLEISRVSNIFESMYMPV